MTLRKILIVDDEVIPRQDLMCIIDWGAYGYEIVGEATNGEQALKMIPILTPDVLITDIKMPVMSGLELIKTLRERGDRIEVVILSCYEEFNYVREALKMGVVDYLVKHTFEEEDIIRVIRKLDASFANKSIIAESIPLIKRDILKRLVKGQARKSEINSLLEKGGIKLHGSLFNIIVLRVSDIGNTTVDENKDGILADILCASDDLSRNEVNVIEVFQSEDNEFVIIGSFNDTVSENAAYEKTMRMGMAAINNVKNKYGISLSAGLSKNHSTLSGTAEAYLEAKTALEYRLFYGSNRIIPFDDIAGYNHINTYSMSDAGRNAIMRMLERNDMDDLRGTLQGVMDSALKQPRNMRYLRALFMELLSVLRAICDTKEIDITRHIKEEVFLPDYLLCFKTVNDMKSWFTKVCEGLTEEAYTRNKYSRKIVLAIEYLKGNFTHDITLEQMADKVGLSRIYLSQLFKKETGMNISDYLLAYRIEKAKELLRSRDLKIYEVAELVGFQSAQHFSSIFKKYTGVSALDFKKTI